MYLFDGVEIRKLDKLGSLRFSFWEGLFHHFHVSIETRPYRQKVQDPNIVLERRGDIEVKGKGTMETFWIPNQDLKPLLTQEAAL